LGKIEPSEATMRVRIITVRDYFLNIPFRTYVMVMLELIGLFANTIAILTFFGAINTPRDSPNFYNNNQEFLVWSLVAGVYTLGLISARFKRRWRQRIAEAGIEEEYYPNPGSGILETLFRGELHWEMFKRDFAFTLAVTFPLTLLYMRAWQSAQDFNVLASAWYSLSCSVTVCIPVTLTVMLASSIFDKALALFAGN
jgi:hypothetical protein